MYWRNIFICVLLPSLIQGQGCKDEVDNCAELLDYCDSDKGGMLQMMKNLCAQSCGLCLKDDMTMDDAVAKYISDPVARSAFMKEFGQEIEDIGRNAAQLVLSRINEEEKVDGVLPNPRFNPIQLISSAKEFYDGFNNPEKDCGMDLRCRAGQGARKAYDWLKG